MYRRIPTVGYVLSLMCANATLIENEFTRQGAHIAMTTHAFAPGMGMRSNDKIRVLLYSHDAMGLGHARRNLLIAETLIDAHIAADVLLVTGVNINGLFTLRRGIEVLTLPGIHKTALGQYQPRNWSMSLEELTSLRSSLITGAVDAFRPDLMIVDNVPRGANNEVEGALELMRRRNGRCVLGLRDILDSPAAVHFEWRKRRNHEAIADYYDEVWIYGDSNFYDPRVEYGLNSNIADKVRFTGYFRRTPVSHDENIAHPNSPTLEKLGLPPGPLALCMVGGGEDGNKLAETFSQISLPDSHNAIVVTGPFMDETTVASLGRRISARSHWRLLEFCHDPVSLIGAADAVIAMGGYNTISEVLCHNKHVLVVPRVAPREEQLIRARRLHAHGLADMCHPELVTPEFIGRWIRRGPTSRSKNTVKLDFNGQFRLSQFAAQLFSPPPVELCL